MGGTKPSRTAQGVAAQRAVLHGIGVIDEPLARAMLTPAMARAARLMVRLPKAMRGRWVTFAGCAAAVQWFDGQVTQALDDGVDQVAVVGAGYDTRAWRFAREGVRFFELDHAVTQQDKQARAPGPGPTYVTADLATDAAADVLTAGGLDPSRPTLYVFEGVTPYLTAPILRDQLAGLAAASAPSSRVVLDFYPAPDSGSAQNRRQLLLQKVARAGSGEGLRLMIDRVDAVAILEGAGWTVVEQVGFREAAQALVPPGSGLPVDAINDGKTLLAARLP